jgi:hypothetical protein
LSLTREHPSSKMKIFIHLFLVFLVKKIVSSSVTLGENENICFFTDIIKFRQPELPEPADIHGKFISNSSEEVSVAKSYDLVLLQDCADLNHSYIKFGQDAQKKRKRIQKLMKSLRLSFKETRDRTKLKATLIHFHCIHALKSVNMEENDSNLIINLVKEFPEVMALHLDIVGNLEDFSFLTPELAKKLFKNRNEYFRPLALNSLIETVSKDVLIELIKMWNFDLCIEDAKALLSIRGDDLLEISEEDPRSWLIWRKADVLKSFPFNLLIDKLSVESFNSYVNLILAFIYDREKLIFYSMYSLEYLHADLQKNSRIEERYMTEEMVLALQSRKWDIWYEYGKPCVFTIDDQMKKTSKLIEKLKEIIKIQEETNAEIVSKLNVINVLTLLQVPLNLHARTTFLKSRDIDQLIAAQESYVYHHPFEYTPIVIAANILNPFYWQVLWAQLQGFGVKLAYDVVACKSYVNIEDLIGTIVSLSQFAFESLDRSHDANEKHFPNYYWLTNLNTLLLSDEIRNNLDLSQSFLKSMLVFMRGQVCELDPYQLSLIKAFLHQDVDKDDIDFLEAHDINFDAFRLAPESLTQEEIAILIQTPELRKLMKYSIGNVNRLRFLDSFKVDDLKEFFPIGGDYHLESCEALYTVDPEALKGYLQSSQGAINYPDLLIWWIHPLAWNNSGLVDLIAESVPFSAFFKHPTDADDLNLTSILTDIVCRISRNPSQAPQKLILKWVIHMEWLFFQFYNHFYIDDTGTKLICSVYDQILGAERKARSKLITWLKENETLEDGKVLLDIVEKGPLSNLRVSVAYDLLLSDSVFKVNMGPKLQYFRDVYPQFTVFTTASNVYKIRETDLEATVSESQRNCELLGEKYLDIIEKEIWMNRLKIFSFTTFSKYLLNPIPQNFADKIFKNHGAPIHDLQTIFSFLSRSGHHLNAARRNFENGFVKQLPMAIEINEQHAKRYADIVLTARRLLLENDLKNMKKKESEKGVKKKKMK